MIYFLFFILQSFAENSIKAQLPLGNYTGINGVEKCSVNASYDKIDTISIISGDCLTGNCAEFNGTGSFLGGGGCTHYISQSEYEIHLSNGKNPQGAPNFCNPVYQPGGVRILNYKDTKKIEIIAADGSVTAQCTILK